MRQKTDEYDVGVLIARFQVHELTEAHRNLLDHVTGRHDKALLFLGVSPLWVTRRNALDFESRKQMVLADYPRLNVGYIEDRPSDAHWSNKLDQEIAKLVTPSQSVVLYGGRDGFIEHYGGRHPTIEMDRDSYHSGTVIRKQIGSRSTKATPDFRAGVIWSTYARFPVCYPTVDIAVFNDDHSKLLLARKPFENHLRFIGGFAEPDSPSFEADARREVAEEAHIEITDPVYIGSYHVDDWRYRGEVDQIKTLLFAAKHQFGQPTPDDDVEELRWVPITVPETSLVETHRPLLVMARAWADRQPLPEKLNA